MRVAALTMSYNEPVWAPIWARHYSRQVGAEHCYLMDHGSDDGSAEELGINVERLARSPLEEVERAARVRARVTALLEQYDAVVHTDTDELVVADPLRYRDLRAFAAGCDAAVITAVGLDVHQLAEEDGLDLTRPIGPQRRWVRFSASMCKPVFVRKAVQWEPGFHACDMPTETQGLFLMHMRYSDRRFGVQRLRRTREQAFATAEMAGHQRVSDDAFLSMLDGIVRLPKTVVPFQSESGPMSEWVAVVTAARARGEHWLSISGDELWQMPDWFRVAF